MSVSLDNLEPLVNQHEHCCGQTGIMAARRHRGLVSVLVLTALIVWQVREQRFSLLQPGVERACIDILHGLRRGAFHDSILRFAADCDQTSDFPTAARGPRLL